MMAYISNQFEPDSIAMLTNERIVLNIFQAQTLQAWIPEWYTLKSTVTYWQQIYSQ